MSENESMYGTTLSQESIKVIAESIGVGNFPDEAAKELAEDVSYRLKEIIQVSCILGDLHDPVLGVEPVPPATVKYPLGMCSGIVLLASFYFLSIYSI